MLFWEIIFSILMLVTIPYKVNKTEYNGYTFYVVHVIIMPWAQGMTIGRLLFTRYKPSSLNLKKRKAFLHHEFQHHKQWLKHGWKFLPLYIWSSVKALFNGKRMHYDNEFEIEAFKAEFKFRRNNNLNYVDHYKDNE